MLPPPPSWREDRAQKYPVHNNAVSGHWSSETVWNVCYWKMRWDGVREKDPERKSNIFTHSDVFTSKQTHCGRSICQTVCDGCVSACVCAVRRKLGFCRHVCVANNNNWKINEQQGPFSGFLQNLCHQSASSLKNKWWNVGCEPTCPCYHHILASNQTWSRYILSAD